MSNARKHYSIHVHSNTKISGDNCDFTVMIPKPFNLDNLSNCTMQLVSAQISYEPVDVTGLQSFLPTYDGVDTPVGFAVANNLIPCIHIDASFPQANSASTVTKGQSNFVGILHRMAPRQGFWGYHAASDTAFAFVTTNPFGQMARFRLLKADGSVLGSPGLPNNIPLEVSLVFNVYVD